MWKLSVPLVGYPAARRAVDAPEHERRVAEVEVVEALDQASSNALRSKRACIVPPMSGSWRSRSRHAEVLVDFEALVGVIDVRLFGLEFGMLLGHSSRRERSKLRPRTLGDSPRCAIRRRLADARAAPQRVVTPLALAWTSVAHAVRRRRAPIAVRPFLDRGDVSRADAAHPGVVHAPGRAQPARVPGGPRRGLASSTRSSSRSWPPRSRCSRSAATASTRRCSTPTSSCRRTPSASASTSHRAPVRSPTRRCVPRRPRPAAPARAGRHRLRRRDGRTRRRRARRDRRAACSPSPAPRSPSPAT